MSPSAFTPDPGGWTELTTSKDGMVGKDLLKRGELLRLKAVKQVGKRTGRLASSIQVRMSSGITGPEVSIGSDHHLSLLQHEGTRPHMITSTHGKLLRFSRRGRIVYAHAVMHPGTKPNRYLTDNLRRVVN